MKPAGLMLPLILASTLLSAEPPATPAPTQPAPAAAPSPTPAATAAPAPTTAPAPASGPTAKPADKFSPGVSQVLADSLPKYAPLPPVPEKPAAEASPDAIELPKVVVKQKRRPRLGDEVMMTNKAFNEKLAKEKTSSFDRDFLNKYSFLGGDSAAERARDEYDRAKRDQLLKDVSVLAKAIEQEDPAQAKALVDAANKP